LFHCYFNADVSQVEIKISTELYNVETQDC